MITLEEALAIIRMQVEPLEICRVPLMRLAGYVLARPVTAAMPLPRFDHAAMDGFGLRAADAASVPALLPVQGTICAGDTALEPLRAGQAVKILTGAPIPPGVDTVVMKEFCTEMGGVVHVQRAVREGENIRRAGEEFQPGDEVLPAGMRVTPPVVGQLAALGRTAAAVRRKPKVAIVVTGSELVRPGEALCAGQIYDANSYAIRAALASSGVNRCTVFHAVDDPGVMQDRLRKALHAADVVLTIGGISVGEFDFVKDAGTALGVTTHFWTVAIKPSKPTYFGTLGSDRGKKYLFGLPGNPVSALLAFHYFVRPALGQLLGQSAGTAPSVYAELATDLKKKAGREELVRGILCLEDDRLLVRPAVGQESHMLGGLSRANCIIRFPRAAERLAAGARVLVDMLEW